MSTDMGRVLGRRGALRTEQGTGLTDGIYVNRFSGGREDGVCTQLTIGDRYVQLDEAGARQLVGKLCRVFDWPTAGPLHKVDEATPGEQARAILDRATHYDHAQHVLARAQILATLELADAMRGR